MAIKFPYRSKYFWMSAESAAWKTSWTRSKQLKAEPSQESWNPRKSDSFAAYGTFPGSSRVMELWGSGRYLGTDEMGAKDIRGNVVPDVFEIQDLPNELLVQTATVVRVGAHIF